MTVLLLLVLAANVAPAADVLELYQEQPTWPETLLHARAAWKSAALPEAGRATNLVRFCEAIKADFPVPWDWVLQDSDGRFAEWFAADTGLKWEQRLIPRVLEDLAERGAPFRAEYEALCQTPASPSSARWWDLYVRACEQRRAERLKTVQAKAPRIVFTKRRTLQPSFFAYTEGQSDAQNERHFRPNSALCLWTLDGGPMRTLLADPGGAIRDPAVSWDGERVVFAWKKSLDEDDYHLYELEIASGRLRQLTSGLGFADYEPAFLPNGDIVFASTRCVQTVDCWWTEVSNLYTCDAEGRYLRRLGFDQVHAVYPQVLDDGRVIYTRWDYNDRSQMWPQALFQMNADGTGQTEFYKNNSWFPTTVAHARGLPGTQKVLAIFTGHHTAQAGKLGLLDPAKGRQENAGAQLIAPVRETRAERADYYGQDAPLFQYPFPLTETEFLVGCAPAGWSRAQRPKGGADFGIYWMDLEGRRELLVTDATLACQQPVPLVARSRPPLRPSTVDHRQTTGTCYVQDVYAGPALAGVPRGTVKKLRVVALEFRAAGVGNNGSIGPSGEALVSTPIAIGNGSWDVKIVLGDAKVHDDGSAFFTVPVRVPVYFQALDDQGRAVQTMRSWTTLQPGENQSCVGCHESKNTAPLAANYGATLALQAGPQTLVPFYAPPRGFSFPKEIQPILDRHCIRCHHDRNLKMEPKRLENAVTRQKDPVWSVRSPAFTQPAAHSSSAPTGAPQSAIRNLQSAITNTPPAFSLLGDSTLDKVAKRAWSEAYLNLTLSAPSDYFEAVGAYFGVFDGRMVNWIGSQSIPAPLPPYAAGACRSELFPLLEAGHYGVKLAREELDKLACWIDLFVPYCGDYFEANTWSAEDLDKYQRFLDKRRRMEALERQNLDALLATQAKASASETLPAKPAQ
ncbi:MAG: hypothetical protein HZA90_26465 [Verrucomicrobia bacterium]|nr:hypothetical protein [Verrucomicrobiota bacterium]